MQSQIIRCKCCNKKLPKEEARIYTEQDFENERLVKKEQTYCENCFLEKFSACCECEEYWPTDEIVTSDGGQHYCRDCYHDCFVHCETCDCELFTDEALYHDNSGPLCEHCYHEQREHHATKPLVPPEELSKQKSLTLFGLEIEAIITGDSEYQCYDVLSHFSVTPDGSLSSRGMEFVSLPLPLSRSGFEVAHQFACEYACENLAVDKSCGLHVHFNVHELDVNLQNLKKIWLAYLKLENYIFSLVPPSRRKNNFCRPMSGDYSIDRIKGFRRECRLLSYYYGKAIKQKANVPKEKYHDKRYYWLNLNSLFYRGTIEIRLHSGTISSRKMVYWSLLHKSLLSWALDTKTTLKDVQQLDRAKLFQILKEPNLVRYLLCREAKFQPRYSIEELFSMFE